MEKHLLGLNGERVCLVAVDDRTVFMLAYPAPSKSTKGSVKALRHSLVVRMQLSFTVIRLSLREQKKN